MNNSASLNQPGIFDSHAHLYSETVIASVRKRNGLADSLCLNVEEATGRTDKFALKKECAIAGVQACLLLPTAPAHKVTEVNDLFIAAVRGDDTLLTAGTLHPSAPDQGKELERLSSLGIRALKLCTFSQGFDLEAPATIRFFDMVRAHNISDKPRFHVILDTFYQADIYFGAAKDCITTPRKLARLASAFPEINFVGAHMGGLSAPFCEIEKYLKPRANLYLDTSNATHILARDEFLRLVHLHGPEHIIFGTDWPWFGHQAETVRLKEFLQAGGLSAQEQDRIFRGNIHKLLGI